MFVLLHIPKGSTNQHWQSHFRDRGKFWWIAWLCGAKSSAKSFVHNGRIYVHCWTKAYAWQHYWGHAWQDESFWALPIITEGLLRCLVAGKVTIKWQARHRHRDECFHVIYVFSLWLCGCDCDCDLIHECNLNLIRTCNPHMLHTTYYIPVLTTQVTQLSKPTHKQDNTKPCPCIPLDMFIFMIVHCHCLCRI